MPRVGQIPKQYSRLILRSHATSGKPPTFSSWFLGIYFHIVISFKTDVIPRLRETFESIALDPVPSSVTMSLVRSSQIPFHSRFIQIILRPDFPKPPKTTIFGGNLRTTPVFTAVGTLKIRRWKLTTGCRGYLKVDVSGAFHSKRHCASYRLKNAN